MKMRHRLPLRSVVLGLIAVSLVSVRPALCGDVAYGEYLSGECVTCHKTDGGDTGIPSIVAWDPESFVAVLQSYKKKERENPVMQTVATSLGNEEMAALAAYFATLKEKDDD